MDKTGIYASEYPGGPPSEATGRVPLCYERVNIFAQAVGADGWTWHMIGPNQWVCILMAILASMELTGTMTSATGAVMAA